MVLQNLDIQEVVLLKQGIVTCAQMPLAWEELVTACQVVDGSRIHELDTNRSMVQFVLAWRGGENFSPQRPIDPIYREDIAKMVAAGQANIIKVWNEEIGDYTPLVKNAGAKRSETEPPYTQRQL